MSTEHIASGQDVIRAEDLVKDLTETTKPVFTRRGKHISGDFDLRYRTIRTAVDLQGCHFLGAVHLGYCEFEQTVDFTGCTFHQGINPTGPLTSHQLFHCRKDFICNEAIFKGPVNFGGLRIEGSLRCDEASFNGPVSFNGVRTEGNARFRKAKFTQKAQEVDFTTFHSEGQINCNEATFNGSASFNSLKCEGAGFFNGATFEGEVDLVGASFGSALELTGATFNKSVLFNQLKCQTLNCSAHKDYGATTFKGKVTFDQLKCEGTGFFNDGVIFEGEANFGFASFSSGLECIGAKFQGTVSLYALKCEGDGVFSGAEFQSAQESDFSFSKFGGSLIFFNSSFAGPLKLEAVEVSRELDLTAQQFEEVSLYNATTDVIALAYVVEGAHYTFPRTRFFKASFRLRILRFAVKTAAKLRLRATKLSRLLMRLEEEALQFTASFSSDLRGFTFNRLRGSKEEALRFAEAQMPTVFSVDPYVQLEKFYEKVGKDTEARDVHYQGRRAMRRNADTSSEVRWTFGRKASDSFLRIFTGYGVRTGRVVWAIVFFLVLGTIVFSLGDFTRLGEALSVVSSETSASSGAAQNSSASEPTIVDQVSYSVDRFIPFNMGIEDGFEPRQPWSQVYDLMHAIAGWLLIPLFLASWSGLVRSRR